MKIEIQTVSETNEFVSMTITGETQNDKKLMAQIIDIIIANANLEEADDEAKTTKS